MIQNQLHSHLLNNTDNQTLFISAIDHLSPTFRLAQLASSLTMGGGPDHKPEHLLVIVPIEEPTEIFDRIRKNHPNIKITFRSLLFKDAYWEGEKELPAGTVELHSLPSQSLAI